MTSLQKPVLSAELCYSPQSLQRFLTLARALSDDSLSADLNSMPVAAPRPQSTSAKLIPGWTKPPRERIGAEKRICGDYVPRSVFESWRTRDEILEYCTAVAAAAAKSTTGPATPATSPPPRPDPRLDPYGARELPVVSREDEVMRWVGNERGVENIIRDRSWSIVCERCAEASSGVAGDNGSGWRTVYDAWKSAK
ncbi:caffeine-induced death protein 2 [Limtongia smithiae]|uniref:caffeine-induced death protein 2 n=1 Tax=Limtongia smithiae TaxID=1125753 RepID=UPI0034CECBF2